MRPSRSWLLVLFSTLLVAAPARGAAHQATQPLPNEEGPCSVTPGEVTGVVWNTPTTLGWDPDACASRFNVYRGKLSLNGRPAQCHGSDINGVTFETPVTPETGDAFFYLVTGEAVEEGTPGSISGGARRPLLGSCDTVLRNHLLNRVAHGWDEWSRDRLKTLGTQAFIDEQLDPGSIDESTNTVLATRLMAIEPPETIQALQAVDFVKATYARRQLEQAVTLFWVNHFNTEWVKTRQYFGFLAADPVRRNLETTKLHYDEMELFRGLAFNGNFLDLVTASADSPAMIIYLDTRSNVAGNPNENYSRELLELHTMDVDGGYTQTDVEELARVFTGWEICRKTEANLGDPLAPCINPLLTEGGVVAHFNVANHDCGAKTLFAGDPMLTVNVPDTCSTPADGVNDAAIALAGIVAHPSTPEFISKKLLQAFVTETPTQAMIDDVVAVWNDAGNPAGVGDLREVLRAVLDPALLVDPDLVGQKVKTPFEHASSILRATRGNTDGNRAVRGYLTRMAQLLHENPVPTGYSELGDDWIDTNNTLERQNLGIAVATGTHPDFGSDLITLLNDNGVSTSPGNAAAIVDFLADTLFGRALDPVERQSAIDFLNTDDSGVPGTYTNSRIRETAGFMLGLGQFQEQ